MPHREAEDRLLDLAGLAEPGLLLPRATRGWPKLIVPAPASALMPFREKLRGDPRAARVCRSCGLPERLQTKTRLPL